MEALKLSKKSGWQNNKSEGSQVTLRSLSELTGFPMEFIKEELLLDEEEISISDLRTKMQAFLVNNF
jgi:hypothetical protein